MEKIIKELKEAGLDKKSFESWLNNENVQRIYKLNKENIKLLKELWKGTPFEKPVDLMVDTTETLVEKSEEFAEEVKKHTFKGYGAE